jgi:hypothetical protein
LTLRASSFSLHSRKICPNPSAFVGSTSVSTASRCLLDFGPASRLAQAIGDDKHSSDGSDNVFAVIKKRTLTFWVNGVVITES